jgi:hypothetical protein
MADQFRWWFHQGYEDELSFIVDNLVIIANSEDQLQKAAHKLYQIIKDCNLNMSVQKTKVIAQ